MSVISLTTLLMLTSQYSMTFSNVYPVSNLWKHILGVARKMPSRMDHRAKLPSKLNLMTNGWVACWGDEMDHLVYCPSWLATRMGRGTQIVNVCNLLQIHCLQCKEYDHCPNVCAHFLAYICYNLSSTEVTPLSLSKLSQNVQLLKMTNNSTHTDPIVISCFFNQNFLDSLFRQTQNQRVTGLKTWSECF